MICLLCFGVFRLVCLGLFWGVLVLRFRGCHSWVLCRGL